MGTSLVSRPRPRRQLAANFCTLLVGMLESKHNKFSTPEAFGETLRELQTEIALFNSDDLTAMFAELERQLHLRHSEKHSPERKQILDEQTAATLHRMRHLIQTPASTSELIESLNA